MAITALAETGQHACRVGCAVAALASRHHFMLVLMTGDASNGFMFCIACGQKFECLFVAGCAHFVRRVRGIRNGCWHMGLVTAFAFSSGHIRAVRFVTLGALWNFAVYVVAETASQAGMLALNLLQLDDLLRVAGKTFFGDVVSQLDDLGGVRVGVAAEAC